MAFQLGPRKGPVAEINVTPLVDVMLVLLVIFMITAPMMFNGIKLQLPKTKKVQSLNLNDSQVILSVTQAGEFYLGKNKVLASELMKTLKNKLQSSASDVVFIRASSEIKYGKVAHLMGQLKRQGISNISLVTEVEK